MKSGSAREGTLQPMIELDLLVLADRRLDHIEPHGAGRNGLGGFKNLARHRHDPRRLRDLGFRDIMRDDHVRPPLKPSGADAWQGLHQFLSICRRARAMRQHGVETLDDSGFLAK